MFNVTIGNLIARIVILVKGMQLCVNHQHLSCFLDAYIALTYPLRLLCIALH